MPSTSLSRRSKEAKTVAKHGALCSLEFPSLRSHATLALFSSSAPVAVVLEAMVGLALRFFRHPFSTGSLSLHAQARASRDDQRDEFGVLRNPRLAAYEPYGLVRVA